MNGNYIITGAAQGFGAEFTRRVVAAGGKVVMADMNEEKGRETCEVMDEEGGQGCCTFRRCDVTKQDDWEELWREANMFFGGKITGLVNNAGVVPQSGVGFEKCMQVNFHGVLTGALLATERLGKHQGGEGGIVINVASMAGLLTGMAGVDINNAAYEISKHGVVAITKSLGDPKTVRKTGVMHVALCPWFSNTNLISSIPTKMKEKIQKIAPFLEVSQVGEAFQNVIDEPRSGSALVICSGLAPFYWPNSLQIMTFMSILTKVATIGGMEILSPKQALIICVVVILFSFLLFHFILKTFGL